MVFDSCVSNNIWIDDSSMLFGEGESELTLVFINNRFGSPDLRTTSETVRTHDITNARNFIISPDSLGNDIPGLNYK